MCVLRRDVRRFYGDLVIMDTDGRLRDSSSARWFTGRLFAGTEQVTEWTLSHGVASAFAHDLRYRSKYFALLLGRICIYLYIWKNENKQTIKSGSELIDQSILLFRWGIRIRGKLFWQFLVLIRLSVYLIDMKRLSWLSLTTSECWEKKDPDWHNLWIIHMTVALPFP